MGEGLEWLKKDGDKLYYSPFKLLSDKTGMTEDALWRHSKGDRGYKHMQFDVADRLLCATNRSDWWHKEPELAECYERACQGADRIYPIELAA